MNTVKITLSFIPFESWKADLWMAELAGLGFDTFTETENGFESYITENNYQKELFSDWIRIQSEEYHLTWTEEIIPAKNWNEEWEKNYFQPLVISDRVVVRAPFHQDYPQCPVEIIIEPNMAFGTGNHETTSLMMETMLEMDFGGKTVLDMGCGTGILAILSSKLGAGHILAIDMDPWAYEAVKENMVINQTPDIEPVWGDASAIGSNAFDIILVNIRKNVILDDLRKYVKALRPGGTILFSGFFENDLPDIRFSAEAAGLVFGSKKSKNNWTAAVFGAVS